MKLTMRVARGSASWLSSHGRGLGPRDALKKDSRGAFSEVSHLPLPCRPPLAALGIGKVGQRGAFKATEAGVTPDIWQATQVLPCDLDMPSVYADGSQRGPVSPEDSFGCQDWEAGGWHLVGGDQGCC